MPRALEGPEPALANGRAPHVLTVNLPYGNVDPRAVAHSPTATTATS